MNITRKEVESPKGKKVVVFAFEGKLTMEGGGAAAFKAAMDGAIMNADFNILVDMSKISYMDATGVGKLVSAFTKVRNNGGSFKLLALSQRVRGLLFISRLISVFNVFENEKSALESFD